MSHVFLLHVFLCYLQFKANDFTPRTPATYDYHCSLSVGHLAKESSVTYGVTGASPLNELHNFHVVNQLPQDIMHVLLEGVIPFELTLLLNHFVTDRKYFTIAELNDLLTSFSFTHQEAKDRPSPIKQQVCAGSASLSQSGKYKYSVSKYSIWITCLHTFVFHFAVCCLLVLYLYVFVCLIEPGI